MTKLINFLHDIIVITFLSAITVGIIWALAHLIWIVFGNA